MVVLMLSWPVVYCNVKGSWPAHPGLKRATHYPPTFVRLIFISWLSDPEGTWTLTVLMGMKLGEYGEFPTLVAIHCDIEIGLAIRLFE